MPIALKHLPSPLMGEGSGGGGSRASSPHPHLPPPRGKGCFPAPVSPRGGGKKGVRLALREREKELTVRDCQEDIPASVASRQRSIHLGDIGIVVAVPGGESIS
jgi:hypothetical protein